MIRYTWNFKYALAFTLAHARSLQKWACTFPMFHAVVLLDFSNCRYIAKYNVRTRYLFIMFEIMLFAFAIFHFLQSEPLKFMKKC